MSRIRFSLVCSVRWTSLSIQFSAITRIVGNDEFEITKKKARKRGIGAKRKYFFSLSLNFFLPQTTLWFATASYDGTPFGWEIYATRTTRGCRGSTQCAPWSARTESIPFRIYRWREWAASGRTLEEPPRWAPVTFTPIPCYDYWSSPLLCSNCDVRSCDALGHLSFLKRVPLIRAKIPSNLSPLFLSSNNRVTVAETWHDWTIDIYFSFRHFKLW